MLTRLLAAAVLLAPFVSAQGFDLEETLRELHPQYDAADSPELRVAQNNGKSLSEAIEQVRRQTKGRIISAETRVNGSREVHYIKVLTKDGKVKTHKVSGRKLGNG